MNPYENSGGFTQPQPRHNAQQQQQQQQPQQQGGYYTPQKYTPNAYQPQQQVPGQQQQQQQHFQGGPRNHMTSPPPLQHPVPTHPPVQMRDPTGTPSPRMNFAQAQGGQYNQSQYRGVQQQQPPSQQQQQQQQHLQQRSSFEQTSLSVNAFGNSPRQQFMSPQHHHQQQSPLQQHPQQQQQQQQSGIPSFPFNLNDGTTQLGMQFGKSAVMAGQEYVEQNLNRWVNRAALQPYFNVSNSYVINKLKLLVFPWRHKTWTRVLKRSETTAETVGYLPPRDDINAPDMYIPVMAFVTYILLTGIQKGTTVGFKPENLGSTASSALAVVLLEFSMIKLFIYLLNISSEVSMLDLLAYSSYKFVSIIVSMVALLAGAPPVFFWGVFLYTGIATGFFLLRSLRYVILPESAAGTVQAPQRKRRINFLICLSVLQFGFMWMLV